MFVFCCCLFFSPFSVQWLYHQQKLSRVVNGNMGYGYGPAGSSRIDGVILWRQNSLFSASFQNTSIADIHLSRIKNKIPCAVFNVSPTPAVSQRVLWFSAPVGFAMKDDDDLTAGFHSTQHQLHANVAAVPEGLCWVSILSCLLLACSYVGSLYVWKSDLPRYMTCRLCLCHKTHWAP